jgi:hypothetical protein
MPSTVNSQSCRGKYEINLNLKENDPSLNTVRVFRNPEDTLSTNRNKRVLGDKALFQKVNFFNSYLDKIINSDPVKIDKRYYSSETPIEDARMLNQDLLNRIVRKERNPLGDLKKVSDIERLDNDNNKYKANFFNNPKKSLHKHSTSDVPDLMKENPKLSEFVASSTPNIKKHEKQPLDISILGGDGPQNLLSRLSNTEKQNMFMKRHYVNGKLVRSDRNSSKKNIKSLMDMTTEAKQPPDTESKRDYKKSMNSISTNESYEFPTFSNFFPSENQIEGKLPLQNALYSHESKGVSICLAEAFKKVKSKKKSNNDTTNNPNTFSPSFRKESNLDAFPLI